MRVEQLSSLLAAALAALMLPQAASSYDLQQALQNTQTEEAAESAAAPEKTQQLCYDSGIFVRVKQETGVETYDLQTYLVHVVLQEMPAAFELEALKAQAVAARTFTVRNLYEGGHHTDADVCADSGCCQCFMTEEAGKEAYQQDYDAALQKVQQAVEATDGQVLTYQDELIEAAYFSSTAGSTESAAAVWGGDVSYLQPVSSPEEAKISEKTVPLEELKLALPAANFRQAPETWVGEITKTAGGAVDLIALGGVYYRGTAIRAAFGLKSARFTAQAGENGITFTVYGSGHGVGMSQYGADEMAKEGADYQQILLHYYTGAVLKELY